MQLNAVVYTWEVPKNILGKNTNRWKCLHYKFPFEKSTEILTQNSMYTNSQTLIFHFDTVIHNLVYSNEKFQ